MLKCGIPPLNLYSVSYTHLQVRRAEIEQVLTGMLRGNFFSVNLEAVRVALEQLLSLIHI